MNKPGLIVLILALFLSSCGKRMEETKPIRKDVTETVFASGELEAKDTYALTAQSDGYLVDIFFRENDIVRQGQLLARLDNQENILNAQKANALYEITKINTSPNSPFLAQAQNAIVKAKKKLEFTEAQYERYKKLEQANSISKADYENILLEYENAKTDYTSAVENYNQQKQQVTEAEVNNKAQKNINRVVSGFNQIKAIYEGRVYQKLKERGDYVRKGDVLATIGDANVIYAKVSVDESNIHKIKVGQDAVIQLNINKEKTYKGKVQEILPAFDEETQSFICKVYFTDPLDFRVVSTQLQVNIIIGVTKNALLIPRNYLGLGNMVKVKGQDEAVRVETKLISTEWVQIVSGIDDHTIIETEKLK